MNWNELLDDTLLAPLLPAEHAQFSKPICAGLTVFLQGLPESRQTALLGQQAALDASASLAERLGVLAHSCPVLQKIGQVLARDQRLAPELRHYLRRLESLPPTIPLESIRQRLDDQLGPLHQLGITLTPPAIAEASVAVVIPFRKDAPGGPREGVFKVLKPGIEERLEQELALLEQVGSHLDQRCEELRIPHLDYQEAFQQVHDKIREEVRLEHEQARLSAARKFYAHDNRVQIPKLFDCCTPQVTAMQRIWGHKVTDHHLTLKSRKQRLGELIVDAMIAKPVFSEQEEAPFHGDPHAGNLFLTAEGRLAILDWSLVGSLDKQARTAIVQVLLGAVTHDVRRVVEVLSAMAVGGRVDQTRLGALVVHRLRMLRQGHFPGLAWLTSLLDQAVQDAGLRLQPDLMMFRKSLYTLQGVVAEVGAGREAFDKVLGVQFFRRLAAEWPFRWLASPNSREFATHLSNFDLTQAILGYPSTVARIWIGQSLDWLNAGPTSESSAQRRSCRR